MCGRVCLRVSLIVCVCDCECVIFLLLCVRVCMHVLSLTSAYNIRVSQYSSSPREVSSADREPSVTPSLPLRWHKPPSKYACPASAPCPYPDVDEALPGAKITALGTDRDGGAYIGYRAPPFHKSPVSFTSLWVFGYQLLVPPLLTCMENGSPACEW